MSMASNIAIYMKVPQTGFHIPSISIPALLMYDIVNFHKIHQDMTAQESTEAFRAKYPGYKTDFDEKVVLEGFRGVLEE